MGLRRARGARERAANGRLRPHAPRLISRALAALLGVGALASSPARADKLDPDLLHLCAPHTPPKGTLGGPVPECSWVQRAPGGQVQGVAFDADAESRFRSLMSELAVPLAPRLVVPAQTLGAAGFQISGELGTTTISRDRPYWNGVAGVQPENPASLRPDGWVTTVGVFVRKGLWLPLPAVEVGGGVVHLVDSQLLSWQGYAKLALHEGYSDWPLPSLAVRGAGAYVTGSEQARLKIASVDVIVSKGIGVLKTFRLEPFGGWSYLFIQARSGQIDATPSCDAYLVRTAPVGQTLGDYCAEAQRGTSNDSLANFTFPDQDTITRHRFFGGAKVKFATVFAALEYELVPAGRSRDGRRANGARDGSGKQEGVSLSAGFDF
jgi:hypothetical protein